MKIDMAIEAAEEGNGLRRKDWDYPAGSYIVIGSCDAHKGKKHFYLLGGPYVEPCDASVYRLSLEDCKSSLWTISKPTSVPCNIP